MDGEFYFYVDGRDQDDYRYSIEFDFNQVYYVEEFDRYYGQDRYFQKDIQDE